MENSTYSENLTTTGITISKDKHVNSRSTSAQIIKHEDNFSDEERPLLKNGESSKNVQNEPKTQLSMEVLRQVVVVLFAVAKSSGDITLFQYTYAWIKANDHCCLNGTNDTHKEKIFQQEASLWSWHFNLVEKSLALPVIVYVGIYSDFVGRKMAMLLSLVVTLLKYGFITLAIGLNLNLSFLYIAFFVSGLGGCENTYFAGMTASVADTTTKDKSRSIGIAIYYSCTGLGLVIGMISSGFLIDYVGFVLPMGIVTFLIFISTTLVACMFTETLQKSRSHDSVNVTFKTLLRNFCSIFSNKSEHSGQPVMLFYSVLVTFFIVYCPTMSKSSILTFYLLRSPFTWSSEYIGYYKASEYFIHVVIGSIALIVFQRCLRDEVIALLGMLSGIGYFVMFAFASNDWMLYAGAAVGVLSSAPIPSLKAAMSKNIKHEKQGSLFAAVYIMDVLTSLVAVTIFNNIYAYTQSVMHSMVFLVMAGFDFIAFVLLLCKVIATARVKI